MTAKQLADLIKDEVTEQESEPKPEPLGKKRETEESPKAEAQAKTKPKKDEEIPVAVPRKNVAIRSEHARRLRRLKAKELERLGEDSQKIVSIRSLLDNAIEQYLKKMEM